MKAAILVLAALASMGSAQAGDLYPKQDCNKVIQSAAAFHQCYAANLDAANKALGDVYEKLMDQKVFYVGSRGALREVERAWISYKDRECKYEYGDGSGGNEDFWLAHADCEIRVTEQRVRELEDRPSCTGGNSVCTPHMR
jgi:uncharacterized protein YecT (DUF1311 family)